MEYMEKVAIILLFSLSLASAQQERCGYIGEKTEQAGTPSRAQMFYLDTANPANCTGNVTSWRVCYYGPDSVNNRGSYWATYAVYRRMGAGSSVRYMRVSEIFRAIRTVQRFISDPIVDGEILQGGFNCYDDSIDVGESPLTIQAGDILGACVFDPEDDRDLIGLVVNVARLPLDVVGEVSGELLQQMGTDECSRTNIPSDISSNQFSTINSRRLHIYAYIEREPITTRTPSTPAITIAATTTTTAAQTIAMTTEPITEAQTTTTAADTPTTTLASQTSGPAQSSPMITIPSPVTIPAAVTEDNTTSSGSTPVGTIVGAIIGVLLIMILGVAIAVVVLYLVRRRITGGNYSTGRRASEKKVYGMRMDNITYTAGYVMAGGTTVNRESRGTLEASAYEVPLSSMQLAVRGNKREDRKYESLEATYALPHEYATVGPNEAKPSNHYEGNYSPLDEVTTSYAQLLDKNKQEDIYGDVQEYLQPATKESEIYAQIKACGIINISSDLIQIKGRIGSGQFGFVEQGVWRNGARDIVVAVKLLKEGADEINKVKFLQEAAIMAQFRHPNVVSLYGVVSKTEPLMLVVELIEKGDLRNYLHTMRPDPGELPASNMSELLLNFCQQVALGMQYLSAKGFVHRDLAARNILTNTHSKYARSCCTGTGGAG